MSFLAGGKALERSQIEISVLRDLRGLAGCSTNDLPATLQKAIDRSKELTKELGCMWSLRLADLAKTAEIVTVGSHRVGIYVAELPRESVPTLAAIIAEATGEDPGRLCPQRWRQVTGSGKVIRSESRAPFEPWRG